MARAWALALVAALATAGPSWASLQEALTAAGQGHWDEAEMQAAEDGDLASAVIEWQRLRARSGGARFAEYRAFLAAHPDWPGLELLHQRGEASIDALTPAAAVLDYFAQAKPQTPNGAYWLALAMVGAGDPKASGDLLIRAWTEFPFTEEEEALYLARFRAILAPYHVKRMEMLLWRSGWVELDRLLPLLDQDHQALALARKAMRLDRPGVDALIQAVPPALSGDPGLVYERMAWRMRRERYAEAAALMQAQSQSVEMLGDPTHWADRRRRLARQLMRDGAYQDAYLLAASHWLSSGEDFADLEWLAGYIALRYLNEAGAALGHFQRMQAAVGTPISLGRSGYWEGRAYEAMGQTDQAKAAYMFGAQFQSSFYGQLAAERGGIAPEDRLVGSERFSDAENASFTGSSVYQAGLAIFAAGDLALSARFFSHLAESLNRAQIGAMASELERLNAPHIELEIAKRAALMGYEIDRPLFPVMPLETGLSPDVAPELALSIARRESEFNPTVVSHVGARGLMQLMPGTAKMMAPDVGEIFDQARLTLDPVYNAKLGAAYLQHLHDRFGRNTVLVAAGYNAGPGRPEAWMARYGDPRDPSVDAVDWIEHIPYRETRNYVMRVLEALAPYRARLSGQSQALGLEGALKAR